MTNYKVIYTLLCIYFVLIENTIYGGYESIKCEVESCKYNNKANSYCTLNEIKVSSTCDNCNARKKETICDSFEEKNS